MLDMSLWQRYWGVLLFSALLDHSNNSGEEAVGARPGGAEAGRLGRFPSHLAHLGDVVGDRPPPRGWETNATPGTYEGELGDTYG